MNFYRKVLLVFFAIFNVVFNEPFLFQCPYLLQWTFLHSCFNELFYLRKLFCFSGPVWCFRILHWYFFLLCLFYFIFNEHVCFSAPTCFNEAFYLSTSINLSISLNYGLLRFYVGFLFYSNVVFSELLCFNDLFFCFKQPFYLFAQWAFLIQRTMIFYVLKFWLFYEPFYFNEHLCFNEPFYFSGASMVTNVLTKVVATIFYIQCYFFL